MLVTRSNPLTAVALLFTAVVPLAQGQTVVATGRSAPAAVATSGRGVTVVAPPGSGAAVASTSAGTTVRRSGLAVSGTPTFATVGANGSRTFTTGPGGSFAYTSPTTGAAAAAVGSASVSLGGSGFRSGTRTVVGHPAPRYSSGAVIARSAPGGAVASVGAGGTAVSVGGATAAVGVPRYRYYAYPGYPGYYYYYPDNGVAVDAGDVSVRVR